MKINFNDTVQQVNNIEGAESVTISQGQSQAEYFDQLQQRLRDLETVKDSLAPELHQQAESEIDTLRSASDNPSRLRNTVEQLRHSATGVAKDITTWDRALQVLSEWAQGLSEVWSNNSFGS